MSKENEQKKEADTKPKTTDKPKKSRERKPENTKELIRDSFRQALGGGVSGATAMFVNVLSLMWIRTIMNYQYRYGTTTTQAMKFLYNEGGLRRFYRGLGPALLQGPLARFGDTAANAGTLAFMNGHPATKDLPIMVKSAAASAAAATFRIFLMPVDTVKTAMQVEGKKGISLLMQKFRATKNPFIFWYGSLASVSATFVGHYPWFATYNLLNEKLPKYNHHREPLKAYGRQAVMGFCASTISDTLSNSLRVIKTTRQTYSVPISYLGTVSLVIQKDGWMGLFGRGLKTRIMANGMQGLLFSVLWKYFEDVLYSDICRDCT